MRRLVLLFVLLAGPLWALDPSEMLDDPVLEERARGLDHALRCVVCQSESVASSNANWAQDARRTVRELITEGATDTEVVDFFVDRYGEFVLMNPRTSGANWLLWAAGPVMLLAALLMVFFYLRGRSRSQNGVQDAELSVEEKARLQEILKE